MSDTKLETKTEKKLYKFGNKNIDLQDYITNLSDNLLSYMDYHTEWNPGLREEFATAANRYIQGLQGQLDGNTDRFHTDLMGGIHDATGEFSTKDDDGIDPSGSEFFYNDKGEAITTDDYNALRKRKLKNYQTFGANRAVADFFKTIGEQSRAVEELKEKALEAFDFKKHGFIPYWSSLYNPAGGKMDLTPILNKDEFNKETGKRPIIQRALYLADLLTKYRDSLLDYDFSNTPYKTKEGYVEALNNVIGKLTDGHWTNDDLIALNQAGIGGDFLTSVFSEEENPDLTKEERDKLALEAKVQKEKEEAEIRQKNFNEFVDKRLADYDSHKYTHTSNNPFLIGKLSDSEFFDENGNFKRSDYNDSFKILNGSTKDYLTNYYNQWLKDPYADPEMAFKAVAGLIGMKSAQLLDNGMYYIPLNEDEANSSALIYDPIKGTLQHTFIGDIPTLWENIKNKYKEESGLINRRDRYNKLENGGTINKYSLGGDVNPDLWMNQQRKKDLQQEALNNDWNTAYQSDRTVDLQEAGNRKLFADPTLENPNNGFKSHDILRMTSSITDIASMLASFGVGVGTVGSLGLGLASTAQTAVADVMEDGLDWGDIKNLGANIGLDLLGVIPVGGAASKGAKIIKNIKTFVPGIITAIGAMHTLHNGPQLINSYNKLLTDPKNLTVDDWRNISTGLGLVTGGVVGGKRYYDAKKIAKQNPLSKNVAVEVLDKDGNKKTIMFLGKDAEAIKAANNSGDIKKLEELTIKKYSNLKDFTLSTKDRPDVQLPWTRKNGFLAPFTMNPKKGRVYNVSSDEKGIYADKGFWHADEYLSGPDSKLFSPLGDLISPTAKTYTKQMDDYFLKAAKASTRIENRVSENQANLKALREKIKNDQTTLNGRSAKQFESDWRTSQEPYIRKNNELQALLVREEELKNKALKTKEEFDELTTLEKNHNAVEEQIKENASHLTNLDMKQLLILKDLEESIRRGTSHANSIEKWLKAVEAGNIHSRSYKDLLSNVKGKGEEAIFKKDFGLNSLEESFANILKKYNIKYKQGGSFAYVRKFQKAGKITNTKSTADWHRDMFSSPLMKSWLDSFNTDNFENFNKLQRSWSQNLNNTGYKRGLTPLERNQGVYDRLAEWNKTGTNEVINNLVQNGTIVRAGDSGDNKLNNYLDGYFGELEYLRHGGSGESWKGYEDDLKNFQLFWKERGLNYSLDPESGMYLLSKMSTESTPTVTNPGKESVTMGNPKVTNGSEDEENIEYSNKSYNLNSLALDLNNPTLTYGFPRVRDLLANNKHIDSLNNRKTFYLDPLAKSDQQKTGLDKEMAGLAKKAELLGMARRLLTTNSEKNAAINLETAIKGMDLFNIGKTESDEILRISNEKHENILNENLKSSHDVAMLNRLSGLLTLDNKIKDLQAYESAQANIKDTFAKLLEFEARLKQQRTQALLDNFALQDIHNAVTRNLKSYMPNLSDSDLAIWNKVNIDGTNFSALTPEEQKIYSKLFADAGRLELEQLRNYYQIPATRWSNIRLVASKKPFTPTIRYAKDGTKLEIQNKKNLSKDNDRFLKYVEENLKRHLKTLDRISKSLYGFVKASIVK